MESRLHPLEKIVLVFKVKCRLVSMGTLGGSPLCETRKISGEPPLVKLLKSKGGSYGKMVGQKF